MKRAGQVRKWIFLPSRTVSRLCLPSSVTLSPSPSLPLLLLPPSPLARPNKDNLPTVSTWVMVKVFLLPSPPSLPPPSSLPLPPPPQRDQTKPTCVLVAFLRHQAAHN